MASHSGRKQKRGMPEGGGDRSKKDKSPFFRINVNTRKITKRPFVFEQKVPESDDSIFNNSKPLNKTQQKTKASVVAASSVISGNRKIVKEKQTLRDAAVVDRNLTGSKVGVTVRAADPSAGSSASCSTVQRAVPAPSAITDSTTSSVSDAKASIFVSSTRTQLSPSVSSEENVVHASQSVKLNTIVTGNGQESKPVEQSVSFAVVADNVVDKQSHSSAKAVDVDAGMQTRSSASNSQTEGVACSQDTFTVTPLLSVDTYNKELLQAALTVSTGCVAGSSRPPGSKTTGNVDNSGPLRISARIQNSRQSRTDKMAASKPSGKQPIGKQYTNNGLKKSAKQVEQRHKESCETLNATELQVDPVTNLSFSSASIVNDSHNDHPISLNNASESMAEKRRAASRLILSTVKVDPYLFATNKSSSAVVNNSKLTKKAQSQKVEEDSILATPLDQTQVEPSTRGQGQSESHDNPGIPSSTALPALPARQNDTRTVPSVSFAAEFTKFVQDVGSTSESLSLVHPQQSVTTSSVDTSTEQEVTEKELVRKAVMLGKNVADNKVSGNSVAGNKVSGNNVVGNKVSGNSVAGNKVSVNKNHVACGDVSGNNLVSNKVAATKVAVKRSFGSVSEINVDISIDSRRTSRSSISPEHFRIRSQNPKTSASTTTPSVSAGKSKVSHGKRLSPITGVRRSPRLNRELKNLTKRIFKMPTAIKSPKLGNSIVVDDCIQTRSKTKSLATQQSQTGGMVSSAVSKQGGNQPRGKGPAKKVPAKKGKTNVTPKQTEKKKEASGRQTITPLKSAKTAKRSRRLPSETLDSIQPQVEPVNTSPSDSFSVNYQENDLIPSKVFSASEIKNSSRRLSTSHAMKTRPTNTTAAASTVRTTSAGSPVNRQRTSSELSDVDSVFESTFVHDEPGVKRRKLTTAKVDQFMSVFENVMNTAATETETLMNARENNTVMNWREIDSLIKDVIATGIKRLKRELSSKSADKLLKTWKRQESERRKVEKLVAESKHRLKAHQDELTMLEENLTKMSSLRDIAEYVIELHTALS